MSPCTAAYRLISPQQRARMIREVCPAAGLCALLHHQPKPGACTLIATMRNHNRNVRHGPNLVTSDHPIRCFTALLQRRSIDSESVESNGASSPASSSSSGVVFSVGNGCSGWNADPKDGFSWNAVVHGLKQAVFVLVSASKGRWKSGKSAHNCTTFSQPSGGSRARNLLILGEALVVTAPSSGDVLWLPSSDDSVSPSGVCVLTERVSPGPPTSETAPAPWNRSANGARWPSGVPREYCAQIEQAVLLARIEDQLLNLLVQTLDRVAHRPSVGVVTSVRVMTGDDEVDDGDGPITTSAVVWEEDGPAESMPRPPPVVVPLPPRLEQGRRDEAPGRGGAQIKGVK
uniref:Uncharacterized protein n=1 Tax=Anopheles merus TaxID=30066 RepID=A0A182UP67_ANOME